MYFKNFFNFLCWSFGLLIEGLTSNLEFIGQNSQAPYVHSKDRAIKEWFGTHILIADLTNRLADDLTLRKSWYLHCTWDYSHWVWMNVPVDHVIQMYLLYTIYNLSQQYPFVTFILNQLWILGPSLRGIHALFPIALN